MCPLVDTKRLACDELDGAQVFHLVGICEAFLDEFVGHFMTVSGF